MLMSGEEGPGSRSEVFLRSGARRELPRRAPASWSAGWIVAGLGLSTVRSHHLPQQWSLEVRGWKKGLLLGRARGHQVDRTEEGTLSRNGVTAQTVGGCRVSVSWVILAGQPGA